MLLNNETTNESSSNKIRYSLASATSRFFARLIDYILVIAVLFLIACGLFLTNKDVSFFDLSTYVNVPSWRYTIFALISLLFFYLYFIALPIEWKGKTIGGWLFKIAIVNVHISRKFVFGLLRREALLWETFIILSFILGIVMGSIGDNKCFLLLQELLNQNKSTDSSLRWIGTLFDAFYYVCGILLFFMILWMFVNNKKRCLQDIMSDTVTIKLNPKSDGANTKDNKKINPTPKNYRLPGEVESIDLGETDNLD